MRRPLRCAATSPLLCAALAARTPLVVLVGMGGIGKTSLAREVAGRCLDPATAQADGIPVYAHAIWISDRDHPGQTRLSGVLDRIAERLGAPELTRLPPDPKQSAVDGLLRARRVLLVLDNLETIADPAVLDWLLRLPEPSTALVTTREYPAAFQDRGAWRIDVGRMTEQEGRAFMQQQSRRIGLPALPDDAAQQELLTTLGGNPKAIELVLGLAKRTGLPPIRILRGAPGQPTLDVAALIQTSWAALDAPERRIVLALTLFPGSVADAVLLPIVGMDAAAFYTAIPPLGDLALIETETHPAADGADTVRRALHPLTRQYATTHGNADDGWFLAGAQARQVAWAVDYVEQFGGHRPNDPAALAQLAAEEPAVWAVFQWTVAHGADRETLALARGLEFFYYTRALWGKNRMVYQQAIAAARRLGDTPALVLFLALLIQAASRQGQPEAVQDEVAELATLHRQHALVGEAFFQAQHAPALAALARGQWATAAAHWQAILDAAEVRAVPDPLITGTQYWLAICRRRQGEPWAAQHLLEDALARAEAQGNLRRAARIRIALADLAVDAGRLDAAQALLDAVTPPAAHTDDEQRAHYLAVQGRIQQAHGHRPAAQAAWQEARRLFTRMGMTAEAAVVAGWLGEA